jgi:hypothetical protein
VSRLTYSRTLQPKTRENVRDVQAMLLEARAAVAPGVLTGAENFAANGVGGPGKIADAQVDGTLAPITAIGVLGGVVASERQNTSTPIGTTFGETHNLTCEHMGPVQPGDMLLIHRGYRFTSGSFAQRSFGVTYQDSAQPEVQVDALGSIDMSASSVGWGRDGEDTAGSFLIPAKSATGHIVRFFVTNRSGVAAAANLDMRLLVAVMRFA